MLSMKQFKISALVRDEKKLQGFKELGVTPIHGSYADAQLLADSVKQADMVVSIADSDDEDCIVTILKAMKERKESTGKAPILVHTVSCFRVQIICLS